MANKDPFGYIITEDVPECKWEDNNYNQAIVNPKKLTGNTNAANVDPKDLTGGRWV